MDPILTPILAGVSLVATDALREGSTYLARRAWEEIKVALGWTKDPAPAELKALTEQTLTAKPELVEQVSKVINNYRQQIGGVSTGSLGTMHLEHATINSLKQVNIAENRGNVNL